LEEGKGKTDQTYGQGGFKMKKQKLTLFDEWLRAIDELIDLYSKGVDPADITCPLCKIQRLEVEEQWTNKECDDDCCCPWFIFNYWGNEKLRGQCYTIARSQTPSERIAKLKDWRKRILRMKRRRNK